MNGLSKIPFDTYMKLPISISDGNAKIQKFLLQSFTILKETIYGQNEAKNKIMQILAQWISNPNSQGQVIALEGPAGVGKTSLIKNGVSRVLQRPFCFYALGGAYDASLLEGHAITYEGSTWGRLCEMLMESRVMNPIIFFDELDKISVSEKGNDINGLMIHLTDPTQNSIYQDKYFSGIQLDFSKAIFFFSYNDASQVNKILKDRLTVIKFHGYSIYEKIEIIQKYLLEDLLVNVGLEKNDVSIKDDVIFHILETYCNNEEGMRDSKRVIEELLLRINLLKLLQTNGNNSRKNNMNKKLEIDYTISDLDFPLELSKEHVSNLLKNYHPNNNDKNINQYTKV
jgi:ATP-dependent Lon protease